MKENNNLSKEDESPKTVNTRVLNDTECITDLTPIDLMVLNWLDTAFRYADIGRLRSIFALNHPMHKG